MLNIPLTAPVLSWRAAVETLKSSQVPSFRLRRISRPVKPCPVRSWARIARCSSCLSDGIKGSGPPRTSAALQPKARSAAWFQTRISPVAASTIIGKGDDETSASLISSGRSSSWTVLDFSVIPSMGTKPVAVFLYLIDRDKLSVFAAHCYHARGYVEYPSTDSQLPTS